MENIRNNLPESFKESMREILKEEYDAFEASYDGPRYVGLRYNPLKASREEFLSAVPFKLEPVDWATEGFYYDPEERPGKSALHEAGAFYIQEPSAMSAVVALDPEPGDRVLDMCAAPGGKSTQIAGRLMGRGLLVSNEYIRDRARILSSNIERMGVTNACVINESPDGVSARFPAFFDKILVDAPCSGEGMFKKEENALGEWNPENVKMCHERQLMILDEAAKCLKAGGVLVYSTCTFNKIENEGTVEAFLNFHPEFVLEKTERFWPHKIKGEGHFVARFKMAGEPVAKEEKPLPLSGSAAKQLKELKDFLSSELSLTDECIDRLTSDRRLEAFGDNLYLLPSGITTLKGMKVERPGLWVATVKKNRLEPSHSLALALRPSDVKVSFALSDDEADRYIEGNTLNCDPSVKGWVLLTVRGFSLAFGKASGGVIKNHYPKGLRRMQ
ncbi:MAG: RsmF rRNA methyltransferase first C-terminal domain-containing protein [Lachnospiraceae bacterium]|nr:RsmF rRNA methyltransferase first C-terminal domain-containing protein [Lachnospiraceae bacterium]